MTVSFPNSTRRQVLKTAVVVACCACGQSAFAGASSLNQVDQITDPTSSAAKQMFRFEPNFIRLSAGDELVFLNSRGEHTVHSVPELWPDGADTVGISNQDEAVVRFEQEGIYGFRCKRHGQYGMVMLVVVGNPGDAHEFRAVLETMKAKKREIASFADLLDRLETS